LAGRAPGDGFFIRHGYGAENTWYNPGYWHTGEDWYAVAGDTAGAEVYAIAAGEVVYVGANYPGRVVIVAHDPGLFSMYGHLDPAVAVAEGDSVERGQLLGAVLRRGDDVPNHLHFEVRTFLTADAVNGPAPRYGFRCGPNCPPGPGYWPITAPDHPSDLGWRNPTHVIAGRMFDGAGNLGELIVPATPPRERLTLWSAPPGERQEALGELPLTPGERLPLLEVRGGPEDSRETSAQGYLLWYRVVTPDGREAWVEAAVASPFEVGGDGRPSSVELTLLPGP
jgi:murein DD-endopeptidase MepM/ murein hydrolase activator NlpD